MPTSRKRKKTKKQNRLKRLQQNNLYAAATQLAKDKMKERFIKKQSKFELSSGQHKHLVSQLVLEFGEDIVSMCETEEDLSKFIPLIIMAWNMGNLESNQKVPIEYEESIKQNSAEFAEMIELLVARKRSLYNEYQYYIADYEITILPPDGRIHLTVSSLDLSEE